MRLRWKLIGSIKEWIQTPLFVAFLVSLSACGALNGIGRVSPGYQFDEKQRAIIYGSADAKFLGNSKIMMRNSSNRGMAANLWTEDGLHFMYSVEPGFYTLYIDNTKCETFSMGNKSTQTCEDPYEYYGGSTMRFKPGHVYYIGHLTAAGEGSYIKFESRKFDADVWVKAKFKSFPWDKAEAYSE